MNVGLSKLYLVAPKFSTETELRTIDFIDIKQFFSWISKAL